MLERIENTISRYNMIPSGIRLGVAVSGGADSVFLLHMLAARGGAELTVLHVDHGLRGAASDGDLEFVRRLAGELGLPFVSHRMGAVSGNLEQFCRQERRAFFSRVMAEGLVERVATGHTVSDQAETVVMRLLRGAGTTGLRGVLPVTAEGLIRPLLAVGRGEVRTWLTERGIAWREDASNESGRFLRNRVRAEVLPAMRELDTNVEAALARVAALAALDEDYWRREAGAELDRIGKWERGGLVLDRRGLGALHPAMLGRVVRAGLERALGGLRRLDRAHVDRVTALALGESGEGEAEVPGGRAIRSMDWVRMERAGGLAADLDITLAVPGETEAAGFLLRTWTEKAEAESYTMDGTASLDWEQLRSPLRLRIWRAGDRFQPSGAAEPRLVKDFFEQSRIPSWDRRLWPIITDNEGIIWIYRLGAAARTAENPSTRIRLLVRCNTVSSK